MILISPSPARDYDKRRWDGFRELTYRLLSDGVTGKVVFVGTKDQREYVDEIVRGWDLGFANLCGDTSIHELSHLIRGAPLLITVNTFTMHLASALDVPCVAIVDRASAEIVAHPNVRQVIMPCTVDEVMEIVNEVLG